VSKSSTCAEFKELSDAIDEGMWLRKLASELNLMKSDDKIVLNTDSDNAKLIISGVGYKPSVKTVRLAYFNTREAVINGDVELVLIASTDNTADGLTKPLPSTTFDRFLDKLHLA
jgi:hypothetical protein